MSTDASLSPYFKHYEPEKQMGAKWVILNAVNVNVGVGCLFLPFACFQVKIVGLGVSCFIIMTVALAYGSVLLKDAQNLTQCTSYPEIVEYAFGEKGRFVFYCFYYLQLALEATLFQQLLNAGLSNFYVTSGAGVILSIIMNVLIRVNLIVLPINIISSVSILLMYFTLLWSAIESMNSAVSSTASSTLIREFDIFDTVYPFAIAAFVFRNSHLCQPNLLSKTRKVRYGAVLYISYVVSAAWYIALVPLALLSFGRIESNLIQNVQNQLVKQFASATLICVSVIKYSSATMPIIEDGAICVRKIIMAVSSKVCTTAGGRNSGEETPVQREELRENCRWINSSQCLLGISALLSVLLPTSSFLTLPLSAPFFLSVLIGGFTGVIFGCIFPIAIYERLYAASMILSIGVCRKVTNKVIQVLVLLISLSSIICLIVKAVRFAH